MSRSELPAEFSGPLEFASLLRTLDQLNGERVGFQVVNRDESEAGSRLDLARTLRRRGDATLDGALFAVGEDALLRVSRSDVVGAMLSTYDGNDYFQVVIDLGHATLIIGDTMITGADLQFPEP